MTSLVEELHFCTLNIPIKIGRLVRVLPAGDIPVALGDSLYLSNLDDMVGACVLTPTVYFYRPDYLSSATAKKSVMETLSDALACVLVPYYPLSGRIRETKNGKLEVFFGQDQGVVMIEAYSDMALAELGELTIPNPAWSPLIYKFPNEEPYKILDIPLLIAQVTVFSCGGFSLGLRLCHCIFDGVGAMQFLGAWAATARSGALVTDPEPCWDRELLRPRNPPMVKHPHIEFMRVDDGSSLSKTLWQEKLVQKCYRISREFQTQLKIAAQTNDKFVCSSFDSMAAHIWKCWVKALDVKPSEYKLRLTFSVNVRQKLMNPPLKDGYYGNVISVACAVSSVYELINGSLADTTRLVREARVGVSEEYLKSTIDYMEVYRPKRLEFGGKLSITQWTRFSLYESADFGWGRPIYAGPIDLTPTPQVCVFLPEGEIDSKGRMVVCICLPESATSRFTQYLCSKPLLMC